MGMAVFFKLAGMAPRWVHRVPISPQLRRKPFQLHSRGFDVPPRQEAASPGVGNRLIGVVGSVLKWGLMGSGVILWFGIYITGDISVQGEVMPMSPPEERALMDEEDMINDFFDCSLTHSHGVLGCDACDEVTAKEDALSQLSMTLRNSSALTSALGSKLMFQSSYTNLAKIGGTSQLSIPGPPAHEWRTSVVIHGQHEGQMAVAD